MPEMRVILELGSGNDLHGVTCAFISISPFAALFRERARPEYSGPKCIEPISKLRLGVDPLKSGMIRLTDEQWEPIRKHFPEERIPDAPVAFEFCIYQCFDST